MKQLYLFLLPLVMFYSGVNAQAVTETRHLKPGNSPKKVSVISSGKTRTYYSLSPVETSKISVQGPGKLKVMTRGQFKPGSGDAVNYTLFYSIDGGEQEFMAVTGIERSKKATYPDGTLGVPGELFDFEIELLRGYHTIEFKLKDNTVNVAARYSFTPAKLQKQEWLAYSPVQPSEPVDLISREAATEYYRFSMEKPLKIDIIGPTELRVLTRTENHYQMKGMINYRVQVKENGMILNTYQLASKVSEIAVYKDIKDLIPGTACEFVIYVPKGKHTYEVLPLDKDKSTLLGRLLIPKKDIKMED